MKKSPNSEQRVNHPNPYHSPAQVEVDRNRDRSPRVACGATATFAVIVIGYAGLQSLSGIYRLITASPPSREFDDNTLTREFFEQVDSLLYREAINGAAIQIGSGMMLALVGILLWRYRVRFSHPDQHGVDFNSRFHRLALFGFASACVGAVAPVVLADVRLPSPFITAMVECFAFLVRMGFAISCFALVLARESRSRFGNSAFSYVLAILGVGLSGYGLLFMILRELSWRWQAFTYLIR